MFGDAKIAKLFRDAKINDFWAAWLLCVIATPIIDQNVKLHLIFVASTRRYGGAIERMIRANKALRKRADGMIRGLWTNGNGGSDPISDHDENGSPMLSQTLGSIPSQPSKNTSDYGQSSKSLSNTGATMGMNTTMNTTLNTNTATNSSMTMNTSKMSKEEAQMKLD